MLQASKTGGVYLPLEVFPMLNIFESMELRSTALMLNAAARELDRLAKGRKMTEQGAHCLKVCGQYLWQFVNGIELLDDVAHAREFRRQVNGAEFFELIRLGGMCARWQEGFLAEFCPNVGLHNKGRLVAELASLIITVQQPSGKSTESIYRASKMLTGMSRQYDYQEATGGRVCDWQPADS